MLEKGIFTSLEESVEGRTEHSQDAFLRPAAEFVDRVGDLFGDVVVPAKFSGAEVVIADDETSGLSGQLHESQFDLLANLNADEPRPDIMAITRQMLRGA